MADRLQWFLELQDRLSGPAARMERELGQVRAQLKAIDIQAKTNALAKITDPLKRQRAELQLHRDKLLLSKSAMDKTSESSTHFINNLHDILHIAQIVGGALERMGHIALDVGHRISRAVSFKQGSMIGLEAILGKGASETFEKLEALAGKIGKPIEQVVNLGRTLANVGVKAGDLEPMVRLIEDLDAMDPGAGEKLAGVIRGIYSTGMMKTGDVEALRGTILKPEKIFEDVANRYGMGRNRFAGKAILDQEIGVGKNIGVSTLLDQVLGLEGGKSGSASARGGQTLESRLARVGTQIERMFSRLSGSRGVKAFEKVLDRLINIFDPDTKTGKAMFDRLNQLSDLFAKVLEPLTGPDGKKNMQEFFSSMASGVEAVLPGLAKLVDLTGRFFGNIGALKGLATDQVNDNPTAALTKEARDRILRNEATQRGRPGGIFVNLTQNIDAKGASKEDAEHIANKAAQKAKDALTDALERGLHGGGQ